MYGLIVQIRASEKLIQAELLLLLLEMDLLDIQVIMGQPSVLN